MVGSRGEVDFNPRDIMVKESTVTGFTLWVVPKVGYYARYTPKGKKKQIALDMDPHGQILKSLWVEGRSRQCDRPISLRAA